MTVQELMQRLSLVRGNLPVLVSDQTHGKYNRHILDVKSGADVIELVIGGFLVSSPNMPNSLIEVDKKGKNVRTVL